MTNAESNNMNTKFKVAAFYCFRHLEDQSLNYLLERLPEISKEFEVLGTVLISVEGVNGTICGPDVGINFLIETLENVLENNELQLKFSWSDIQIFRRFKARRKNEIVTMGIEEINLNQQVGDYVEPRDWNSFLRNPDTLIIDTRNNYEVGIGTFKGSINPNIDTFREFPKWVNDFLSPLFENQKPKKIAMFCTGGIRCEKATSYLIREGFKNVHHLHGGILKYLEEVPLENSLWEGECFVFDQRVALNHQLLSGEHSLCFACGMPINLNHRKSHKYIPGVQCDYCEGSFTDKDRARFSERQKQFEKTSK